MAIGQATACQGSTAHHTSGRPKGVLVNKLVRLLRQCAFRAFICAVGLPANAFAAVELYDFQFVSMRGRPGHEGYFPLQASPVAGSDAVARVRLIGPVQTAQITFVAEDGSALLSLPL